MMVYAINPLISFLFALSLSLSLLFRAFFLQYVAAVSIMPACAMCRPVKRNRSSSASGYISVSSPAAGHCTPSQIIDDVKTLFVRYHEFRLEWFRSAVRSDCMVSEWQILQLLRSNVDSERKTGCLSRCIYILFRIHSSVPGNTVANERQARGCRRHRH